MQAASDIFLGWTDGAIGRDYYFRQLRDAKISAIEEDWDHGPAGIRQVLRLVACTGACAIRRPGEDCRLHGLQYDFR